MDVQAQVLLAVKMAMDVNTSSGDRAQAFEVGTISITSTSSTTTSLVVVLVLVVSLTSLVTDSLTQWVCHWLTQLLVSQYDYEYQYSASAIHSTDLTSVVTRLVLVE